MMGGSQALGRMVQSVYLDTSSEAPGGNMMGTGAGIGSRMPYNRMNSDQLRGSSHAHGMDDTLDISSHQQSFDQN
jgi:hypothetical protein